MKNLLSQSKIVALVMVLVGLLFVLSPTFVNAETSNSNEETLGVIIESKNQDYHSEQNKLEEAMEKMSDYTDDELFYIRDDVKKKENLTQDEEIVVEAARKVLSIRRSDKNTKSFVIFLGIINVGGGLFGLADVVGWLD